MGRRARRTTALVLASLLIPSLSAVASPSPPSAAGTPAPAAGADAPADAPAGPQETEAAQDIAARLPVRFEPNRGQYDRAVEFVAHAGRTTLFLTGDEAVLSLSGSRGGTSVVRLSLNGAEAEPVLEPSNRLAGVTNYLVGKDRRKWITGVEGYGQVRYRSVYPGVDLVFHGGDQGLEYDFVVAPGADPGVIDMEMTGGRNLRVDPAGDLVLATSGGELRQPRPLVSQSEGDGRATVAGSFSLHGRRVGFDIGAYDHEKALVIDPVLAYSSYLGGRGEEFANAVAVDAAGNAFVAGTTTDTDFPTTTGTDRTCGVDGNCDPDAVFHDGSSTAGSTAYTSASALFTLDDVGREITGPNIPVGARISAVVDTTTITLSAPATGTGASLTFSIAYATFFDGRSTAGSTTVSSTLPHFVATDVGKPLYGLATFESAVTITAVVDAMTVTVSAAAVSSGDHLVFQIGRDEFADGVLTAGSTTLTSATANFLPSDEGRAIYSPYPSPQVVPSGATIAQVVDATTVRLSTPAFVSTSGARFQIQRGRANQGAQGDAFVTKVSADGSQVIWSTYLGGSGIDGITAIALDSSGAPVVTGATSSLDFPSSVGAFSTRCGIDGGCTAPDAFVARLALDGRSLDFATYLGGRDEDSANGIAFDPSSGTAWVTGQTISSHFPTTGGALATTCGTDGSCNADATFNDGASVDGSPTYRSEAAAFTDDDLEKEIYGEGIPSGTTIVAVVDESTITLSQLATVTRTGLTFSIANSTFDDGAAEAGSTTYTTGQPHFVASDAGKGISGDDLPGGTTIVAVVDAQTVTLSAPATASGDGLAFTIARATFADGVSTIGTPNYTSLTADFRPDDQGKPIRGTDIPDGTTIQTVVDATTVTLSQPPTADGSGLAFTIDRDTYQFSGRFAVGQTHIDNFAASFTPFDVGKGISGDGIAPDTVILSVTSASSAVMSKPATATEFSSTITIARTTFVDGASTSGTPTFASASASFTAADVGKAISGTDIAPGSTILAVVDAQTVTMSQNATGTGTGLTFTVERNSFTDGVATTASPPYTSATAAFTDTDVGRTISGPNLAPYTTIASVIDAQTVTLSQSATGTGAGLSFTIDRGRPRGSPRSAAFVTGVGGDGTLVYSTYVDGSGDDVGYGIAMLGSTPVVTGSTSSGDFPVRNALQPSRSNCGPTGCGPTVAFVTRLGPNGSGPDDLVASTYLGGDAGGNSGDVGRAVAVDRFADVVVAGSTTSRDFPTRAAFQPVNQACTPDYCGQVGFVTRMAGSNLVSSSLLGGSSGQDAARGVAVDKNGAAHVVGSTSSSDFPTKAAVHFLRGEADAFAAKVDLAGALASSTYLGGTSIETGNAVAVDGAGSAYAVGTTYSDSVVSGFPTTGEAFDRTCGQDGTCNFASDSFVSKLVEGTPPAVAGVSPPGGPVTVATPVVITGSGFTGATEVRFGDVSAAFHVDSDTRITTTSPPHDVGHVDVVVVHGSLSSLVTDAASFQYGEGTFIPTSPSTIDPNTAGSVVLPDGKVLVSALSRSALYDPATGEWAPASACGGCAAQVFRAPLALLPSGPSAICAPNCGKVLVAGGFGPGGFSAPASKEAYLYDPADDSWTKTGDLNVPRVNAGVAVLPSGKVLITGGCSTRFHNCGPTFTPEGDFSLDSAELFDPTTGTWSPTTGSPGSAVALQTTTVLDPAVGNCADKCGKVLVAGGVSQGVQQGNAEIFDPGTATFAPTRPMLAKRYLNPAVQLQNGRVLVVGGYNSARTTAETWDPAGLGTWRATAPMSAESDLLGSAVALGNGHALNVTGRYDRQAQVYAPETNSWALTVPMLNARSGHTTTMLPNGPLSACGTRCGNVLIVGGGDDGRAAELYVPRPSVSGVTPAVTGDAGGAMVTLTGSGMASVTGVSFGGVPATSITPDRLTPATKLTAVAPAHSAGTFDVTVTTQGGTSPTAAAARITFTAPGSGTTPTTTTVAGAPAAGATPLGVAASAQSGYRLVASDGGVFAFGGARFFGSTGALKLNKPIVGMATTSSGDGYWLVASDGGVFAFGDARFLGSTGALRLNAPIVAMTPTPSGLGYRLVAADGGIFAFGDASFHGSTGATKLNKPIVGISATPSGKGYWLVASDGGVFSFGDARFAGSTGAITLARPVVGMAGTPSGGGYRLVASDGGIFAFGDARFLGSTGALKLNRPVVGMASTATGGGYWLVASDGGIFAFGDARFLGSTGAATLNLPMVGMAASPASP